MKYCIQVSIQAKKYALYTCSVVSPNLRDVVQRYNTKFGSWAFHVMSYEGGMYTVKEELMKKSYKHFDFTKAMENSKMCETDIIKASRCNAKYIFRSISPNVLNTHTFAFTNTIVSNESVTEEFLASYTDKSKNVTFTTNSWLDPSEMGKSCTFCKCFIPHLVVLHLQNIQGLHRLASSATSTP